MTTRSKAESTPSKDKDFVTRLADAGEEALQKLADLPGGQRALNAMNDLRARVDELGKMCSARLPRDHLTPEERVAKAETTLRRLKGRS